MVQRMLGHADATETLNTYAKLLPDRLDEVTEKIKEAREQALRERSPSQTEIQPPGASHGRRLDYLP